jgi:hypothetical protein
MAEGIGLDLEHFAAIEVDGRGLDPFAELLAELNRLDGHWWTYSLDDGRTEVDMGGSRWRHITVGQNLVTDRCQSDPDAEWLLFLAADCAAPSDIVPRMVEMRHPIVAPYITTYGLRGPKAEVPYGVPPDYRAVSSYPVEWGVEDAMASAAAIMIHRSVFRVVRWRWDLDTKMSDDPCFHLDARRCAGIPTHVRHDVLAKHYPEAIGDYKSRGYDTTVVRP